MSDRLVTEEHWKDWLGDMPMPEGATSDMMYAAYDALKEIEDREEDLKMLQWYQESKINYEKKIEFWKTKTNEPDYHTKLATLENIMKLIDEGIELLRERLVE